MRFVLLLTILLASSASAEPVDRHRVIDKIVGSGMLLVDEEPIALTKPLFSAGMSSEEQEKVFAKLVGERRMARYLEDSLNAPYVFELETLKKSKSGDTARAYDLYFVAHCDMALLRKEGLLQKLMGAQEESKESKEEKQTGFETYAKPADASRPRRDKMPPKGTLVEDLYKYRFPLLERVVVSGLVKSVGLESDGALLQSIVTPKEMLNDETNLTQWFPIPRRAKTDAELGPPEPFTGFVCYFKATELKFAEDAILVEAHAGYLEPVGWFRGRNILASKLPLMMKQSVEDFRRKLKEAGAKAAE